MTQIRFVLAHVQAHVADAANHSGLAAAHGAHATHPLALVLVLGMAAEPEAPPVGGIAIVENLALAILWPDAVQIRLAQQF
eukprot:CAMPEP_0202063904 /NCGR_PEP_ID=MMETSP0963-20130614/47728_1 /ASSEMBLY_ACC=CAM_ASM_000494 /TAXON_ID=4773 /ORGANISM="Schizochytrium aggregatum, Strain ATCC28209" /LENGTH=80 /DNA_ID=CAMNT_0048630339 /DNA_START=7 /DNA_END=247 /DNA_ORIENTATION=+